MIEGAGLSFIRHPPHPRDQHYPTIPTHLPSDAIALANTLVMSIAANIGDVAIMGFAGCFPDSIVGLVPHKDIDIDFLYYNLKSMKAELLNTATLNTQLNINVERIGALFTVLPPKVEQRAIASYLDRETGRIDAITTRVREQIERLREVRAALITAAVTGQIDVREESG